ncbi:MAG: nucleotidyltransferase family protein [Alphaproteobacteria bacterium]
MNDTASAPLLAGLAREGELPAGLITPVQETLLRIVYSPDAIAKPLFDEWQSSVDMQDLDDGCYRLYPYLYRRVRVLAPTHPFLGRLKGLFRRSLYRNHLLFQWAREIIGTLRGEGIDAMVLKGAALVRSLGLSAGFRPMSDVDLLVRTREAPRAMELAGPAFRAEIADPQAREAHFQLRHGISVMDPNRLEIDLHWRVGGAWAAGEEPDAPFWDTAETLDLHGMPVRVLAPTELLFHVIVHGMAWNIVPSIRWISDSIDIITGDADRIDWTRLVGLARTYQRSLTLRLAFAYLDRRFGVAVPAATMAALRAPVTVAEEATMRLRMRPFGLPAEVGEMRAALPARLERIEERLPGRRRLVYLNTRVASPRMIALAHEIRGEPVIELTPGDPLQVEVRRLVSTSAQWERRFDGAPALLATGLELDAGPYGRLPVYAAMTPEANGKWSLRAFATPLRDWPLGAIVHRMDAVMGFALPSVLGRENTVPSPFLPLMAGFPEVVRPLTPAVGGDVAAPIEAGAAPPPTPR